MDTKLTRRRFFGATAALALAAKFRRFLPAAPGEICAPVKRSGDWNVYGTNYTVTQYRQTINIDARLLEGHWTAWKVHG